LLRTAPLETLLVKDDELVHQVKGLDSDMQMLVYENYNKFISATDTIRKMKGDVETMETEMDQLVSICACYLPSLCFRILCLLHYILGRF
jgi:hypothetical protein